MKYPRIYNEKELEIIYLQNEITTLLRHIEVLENTVKFYRNTTIDLAKELGIYPFEGGK